MCVCVSWSQPAGVFTRRPSDPKCRSVVSGWGRGESMGREVVMKLEGKGEEEKGVRGWVGGGGGGGG